VHGLKPPGSSEATTAWTAEVSIRAELLAGRLGTRGCQVADGIASRGAPRGCCLGISSLWEPLLGLGSVGNGTDGSNRELIV